MNRPQPRPSEELFNFAERGDAVHDIKDEQPATTTADFEARSNLESTDAKPATKNPLAEKATQPPITHTSQTPPTPVIDRDP